MLEWFHYRYNKELHNQQVLEFFQPKVHRFSEDSYTTVRQSIIFYKNQSQILHNLRLRVYLRWV